MKNLVIAAVWLALIAPAMAASPYEGSIDHKQDADWQRMVNHAKKLSAKQNHGHPDFVHTCYAEEKDAFCADTIAYKNQDGYVTLVRVIRRGIDNSVYARDVCAFNKAETIRFCVNFDNGYKSWWADKDGYMVQVYPEESNDEAASGGL